MSDGDKRLSFLMDKGNVRNFFGLFMVQIILTDDVDFLEKLKYARDMWRERDACAASGTARADNKLPAYQ